jgi:signal transduction histidine kinase
VSVASDVPDPAPPAAPRLPHLMLRTKGLVLFAVLTLYVIGATALLAGRALQLPAMTAELYELIGVALVVALLGLATFGAFLTLFLGRLAQDLGRLQVRALEVVAGYRGAPLPVAREDELGVLTRSINHMAATLDAREREVMLGRLDKFHQERMTLLGGVAAGLAHEIGNPVAALSALAAEEAPDLQQLQVQARRLTEITRRMAMAAGTRSREMAPLSLNAAVQSVAALLAFDQRFRRIDIALALDAALPLVRAAEDEVVQMLFFLMANALEALQEAQVAAPRIGLATRRVGDNVELCVSDNGCGMDEATRARAFEPFFTTKNGGRGNGLGLDACRAIVERAGGSIALESAIGLGTRVACRIPALL